MQFYRLFFLPFFIGGFLISPLFAAQKEPPVPTAPIVVKSFPEITDYLKRGVLSLVVVDLDNTLMIPVESLGEDPWKKQLIKKLEKMGVSKQQAPGKAQKVWEYIHQVDWVEPVEERIAKIIGKLQDYNIPVMGITERPSSQAERTQKQLKQLGIDLKRTAVPKILNRVFNPTGVVYLSGVLYTGPKMVAGKALADFLNQNNFAPQALIYVDDSYERVTDVQKALKIFPGVQFTGIHYLSFSQLERKAEAYLTPAEKRFMNRALNDPQVQKIINSL